MQPLSEFAADTHLSLLPEGITHPAALEALTGLLRIHAGPETAGLFAAVREGAEGHVFLAPEGRVARFDQLDAEGRARLRAEIGRLASLLRRTAEEAARAAPAAHGGLPALVAASLEVPSFEHVYALAGRPVLAGWGLAPSSQPLGAGLLRVLEDGKPAQGRAGLPIVALGLGALGLVLLGALSAAAVPMIFGAGERFCRIAKDDVSALLRLQEERDREQALRGQIAGLQSGVAQRRAQCPIPPISVALPPQATRACNLETNSGGQGVTVTRHRLGPTRGRVILRFDAQSQPDQFAVLHRGRQLGSSGGFRSGVGSFSFDWIPGGEESGDNHVVEVRVVGNPGSATTVWSYLLGCPE